MALRGEAKVLMINHVHLVVETPEATLSDGMHFLDGEYAKWVNRKRKRSGHLFQGCFHSFLIEKEAYLMEVMRYVALNPVRAKLAARPEYYALVELPRDRRIRDAAAVARDLLDPRADPRESRRGAAGKVTRLAS